MSTNRIENINYERILWCCKDNNISIEMLADKFDIPKLMQQKSHTKNISLTYKQLENIGTFFNTGVLFFLEEGIPNVEIHSVAFRSITKRQSDIPLKIKSIIKKAEFQRDIYSLLVEEIGIEHTSFNPPLWNTSAPKLLAHQARIWLNLDSNLSQKKVDFENFRSAVENIGILVFRSNGYNGSWQFPQKSLQCGFSLYHNQYPVIVIKKEDSNERMTFTLMHELGHILLHKDSFIDSEETIFKISSKKEEEANIFAGHILVTDVMLEGIHHLVFSESIEKIIDILKPIAKKWGVSIDVILLRLIEQNKIPKDLYQNYLDIKSKENSFFIKEESKPIPRKYRFKEPISIFGKQYVATILTALSENKITLHKATTYLDKISTTDLHKLEACSW